MTQAISTGTTRGKSNRGKSTSWPRARQVIQHAIEQARQFADRSIGTGYLLLGLLHVQKGVAARVLVNVGLDREAVRKEVIGRLDAGDD